ncbi:DUF429 domain-containing protein [Alkalihalobacillus sp. TS-13]|uniref:DUF429 domain-containing protein n=1 Tax=Alkalihalobacillus sp. TS-13 TaxID=2842455 RepID=UPI001C881D4C|nr:DUF429 domain-containing protein [Alkalihalobacillus sp. TS-13]
MAILLGIGWDVGGWMGTKQGIAACTFNTQSKELQWIGKPKNTKIIDHTLWTPQNIIHQLDHSVSIEDFDTTVLGIDASLGFPLEYKKLVNNERTSVEKPSKEIFNPYAYRETERHVYERFGKKPLSAPFDKLGNNATLAITYAMNWYHEQSFVIHPQQRWTRGDKVIIEVYPALIKSFKPSDIKNKILSLIPDNIPIHTDAYDAAICALLALLYAGNGEVLKNIFLKEPCIKLETATQEGWIYYPVVKVEDHDTC